jgi:hypothetical protein
MQFPPNLRLTFYLCSNSSPKQLNRVEQQLEPEVAHFDHTHLGLGIAHPETELVLFLFKTPVTEIELSVALNFNFRFVAAESDEADYSFHALNLPLQKFAISNA